MTGKRAAVGVGLLVLGLAVIPIQSSAGSASTPSTDAAVPQSAAQAPAIGPTGHFHPLSAPVRVISTLSGTGVAAGNLAANAVRSLQFGGRAGVPSSGVRAVAVTISVVRPASYTSIWLSASTTKPPVASVTTQGPATSAFAILPVSLTGGVHVWVGAHATGLIIDVTGWFSRAAETGARGLMNPLAGRAIPTLTLKAGQHSTRTVVGVQDIPKTGVQSLLVRITTSHATKPGTVALASSGTGNTTTSSISYRAGTTADLAVVRVSSGQIDARNNGPAPVVLRIEAVGWFTDGRYGIKFGDVLDTSRYPGLVLSAHAVGPVSLAVATTGTRGIPSVASTRPPALVLWRTLVTSVTQTTALTADPDSTGRTGAPTVSIVPGRNTAGLVLAPPGPLGKTALYTGAGTARVTAEAYAWFAGGIVLADGTHILTGTTQAALSAVTADGVTFTGHPTSISDLAVGDVLVSGRSAAAPSGLLRKVDTIDATGANTVIGTSQAALSDAILQGSASIGRGKAAIAKAATPAAQATLAGDGCGVGGSLLEGLSIACATSFGGAGWSASVSAAASASLGLSFSIESGLPPKVFISTTVDLNTSASAFVQSSVSATLELSTDIPIGPPVVWPIMIGPVPSVIEVQLAAEITMSGSIAATVSATATSAAGARMHCDTSAGCSGARHNSGSFSGSYLGEEVSTVSASFGPSISATLDGGLALELSAAPNLSIDVNKCLMTFKAGFSQSIAFNLSFFGHGTVGFNFDLLNIEVTLGTIPISNCVIWSGTLSLNSHVNYVGVETTRDANGSSSMTIDDVHGVPPAFQVYPMSGSGSGTTIEKHFFTCGGAPPTPAVWTYQYNWAGDITNAGTGKVSVDIAATGAPGGWRLFVVGHPSTQADQTITIVDSNCTTIVDTAHIDDWQQDVFSVFSPGDTSTTIGTLFFTVAPGSSTSVGTATFPADENTPGYTLHWSLTKTCLMGGTAC